MDAFYEAINDPKKDGAIFFAVCRGKVGIHHSSMYVALYCQVATTGE